MGSLATRAERVITDRAAAYLIDFALLSLGVVLLWIASVVGSVSVGLVAGAIDSTALLVLGSFLVPALLWTGIGVLVFGYFTFLDGATEGTLGKRVQDLQVVTEDGGDPTMKHAAIRTAVLMVPFPLMALLGFVGGAFLFVFVLAVMGGWLLVEAAVLVAGSDGRRLGDKAAGTYVVPNR